MAKALESKTVALVVEAIGFDDTGSITEITKPFCSGVWVSETSILTANHCVSDDQLGDDVGYVVHDDVYAPGELHERPMIEKRHSKLYAKDEGHDLALLRAYVGPEHSIAHVSLEVQRQGAPSFAMGHSLGLWYSFSSGEISAVRQGELSGLDILWIQATTPVSPGNSGGGLFDSSGSLIGLTHATATRGQLINFFVHGQYLDAFMRRQDGL